MIHVPGEQFSAKYREEEVSEMLKDAISEEETQYTSRVLNRLEDVKLTPLEIEHALEYGAIQRYEVTPSRWEIRIEIAGARGDMLANGYLAVVYLSKQHKIYVEDVRDRPSYG